MVNLNQLLHQKERPPEKVGRERRGSERHDLPAAPGKLNYKGESFNCQVLDISMTGCRVKTQTLFRDGAIANVELELSIFGLPLKICGVTQWSASSSRQVGIRFIHPGVKTKNQVAGIISCLIDESARAAVQEALAAEKVEPIAPQQVEETVEPEEAPISSEKAAVLAILGDSSRIKAPSEGEWSAMVRNVQAERLFPGSLTELSQQGCCVLFKHSFTGLLNQEVEVEFEIQRLHFRLAGVPKAVHDGLLVGIQFNPMTNRRKEELTQLIAEVGGKSAS